MPPCWHLVQNEGFLSSILSNNNACEYGGYLTKVARDQCHTVRPANDTRYRPLLDLKPTDSSIVKIVVITADKLPDLQGHTC